MRRFLLSLTFCAFLLISGAFILSTSSAAKDDVISQLLKMPAPPPPNPLVPVRGKRDEHFNSKRKVPADDAPIRELMDYWRNKSSEHRELGYTPKPSLRVLERLKAEILKDPRSVAGFLNIFNDSSDGADFVKGIYDNWPAGTDDEEYDQKGNLKAWLTSNSPYFTAQLEKTALKAGERGEYVTNHNELLTLAKYDWNAARPKVDELYADSSKPTSRILGTWALYVHALEENSLGDIDRYRDELKAVVEDKKASPGMRDLAFDALVKEKDWSGRDDWYFSLLPDETLAELRVNGSVYTGLTTIVQYSHPDKYADKMIELVKSTNPVVRGAAARNLAVILDAERPDVVKALLPWLEDPKWASDTNGSRQKLLRILQAVKVPESVPVLMKLLDEKETIYVNPNAYAANGANMMANAANTIANAAAAMERAAVYANAANTAVNANRIPMNTANAGKPVITYPLRSDAVNALSMQEDMRAAPALRRILRESEGYMRNAIVKAILRCKGYTVAEQANSLETYARLAIREVSSLGADEGLSSNVNSVAYNSAAMARYAESVAETMASPEGLQYLLGTELLQIREPGDQLVREVIARITLLEKREPDVAVTLRGFLLMWKGPAINSLLLKDLKDGRSDAQAIVKVLSLRKELQEKHSGEVSDLRKSNPMASAVAAVVLDSEQDQTNILNGADTESKAALLACARLIRSKLPVKEVAKYVSHTDKRLATAAESYLESEDSPEARAIVLSLHPNDAKVMGATTGFWPEGGPSTPFSMPLLELFQSMSGLTGDSESLENIAVAAIRFSAEGPQANEKQFRDEIKNDADLVGLYSYTDNVVRIHKDKVLYSWGKDESRFNERTLSKEEFDRFTDYLRDNNVDELVPFLDCEEYYCGQEELLMLGKSGGRRVFVNATRSPDFFEGLTREFDVLRQGPSKLRYRLEKEIPGLEILLADDDFAAKTVWTNNGEVRVLVADAVKRKQIDSEIEKAVEEVEMNAGEAAEDDDEDAYQGENRSYELEQKRRYESYDWFDLNAGRLSAKTSQPPEFEYIPHRDAHPVTADIDRWKLKTTTLEIRADDEGSLHKIVAGKISKFKSDEYSSPVLTPNGKWVFASRYGDEGMGLVRINTTTGREFPVKTERQTPVHAISYVASIGRMLASPYMDDEYRGHGNKSGLIWIDPETGAIQPATGELRPLEDQTFRALQPGPGAFEFWAAVYDPSKKQTVVGVYSTRTFTLRPVLTVPKIQFNSMGMWVDQTAGKVYFVYNGHLLSLPLTAKK